MITARPSVDPRWSPVRSGFSIYGPRRRLTYPAAIASLLFAAALIIGGML